MSGTSPADIKVRPESITTKQDIDFTSDDEAPNPAASGASTKKVSFQEPAIDETPPPKPPRPMSPIAQAETTLMEAFAGTDPKVIKAVLVASGGKIEPAFNALLSMSDPNFKADEQPPQPPPRPGQPRGQLEQDELYARQLAAHYQASSSRPHPPRAHRRMPAEEEDEHEHSFFDDDLPVIQENIKKGFLETQSKVNRWITDFKKKLDGEDEDEAQSSPSRVQRQDFGSSQADQLYGIRKSAEGRHSVDRERYDADHRVLSDDFSTLELRDTEAYHSRPHRPLANPDLFGPTAQTAQSGPIDEVNLLYHSGTPPRQPSPGVGKTKKWQPLTTVAPKPEADDHDPFSLGDSDDEQQEAKMKDMRAEDSEELKKAAPASEASGKFDSQSSSHPAEKGASVAQNDGTAEELCEERK